MYLESARNAAASIFDFPSAEIGLEKIFCRLSKRKKTLDYKLQKGDGKSFGGLEKRFWGDRRR